MENRDHLMRISRFTLPSRFFWLSWLGLVLLVASCRGTKNLTLSTATPQNADWYSVYFTDPLAPGANANQGGLDEVLAEAIEKARLSIDVAASEFGSPLLQDALVAAQQRGVQVRVVTDSDNMDYPELQALIDAGIPVLGDRRESLMHSKFMVIDRQEVWAGSLNFTDSDIYRNNNNLLRIDDSRLAKDYLTEFEEMFVSDLFGQDIRADTPYPKLEISGTPLEVYYSPDDGIGDHLVQLLASAKESIHFLAFSFTSNELAEVLIERAKAGIIIQGVMDESQVQSNTGTEYDRFRQEGIDVRLDANEYKMHHKVFIVDGKIVVTGSYNFSANAEKRNDENLLIIYNKQLVEQFMYEFQRLFQLTER